MKFAFFCRPSLLGLDIDHHQLRLAQFTHWGKRKTLSLKVTRPFNLSSEDDQANFYSVMTKSLKEVVNQHGLSHQFVAIGLPAHRVHRQQLRVPVGLKQPEVERLVHAYLSKDLLQSSDDLCVDYHFLNDKKSGQRTLLIAATKKNYLTNLIDSIEASGLRVKVVDLISFAFDRALVFFLGRFTLVGLTAFICIGQKNAWLLVKNEHDVLVFQHWFLDEMSLPDKLEASMATHLSAHSPSHFVLCEFENAARIELKFAFTHQVQISKVNQWLPTITPMEAENFMPTLGLALRDVPKWC